MIFSTHLFTLSRAIGVIIVTQSPSHSAKFNEARNKLQRASTSQAMAHRRQAVVQASSPPHVLALRALRPGVYAGVNGLQFGAACVGMCGMEARSLLSAYNIKSGFRSTTPARFFPLPLHAKVKGTSTQSSIAVIAKYRQAAKYSEHRTATSAVAY